MLRQVAGEQVIHDWPPAATWLAKPWPARLTYAGAVATLDAIQGQAAALEQGIDLAALVMRARRYMREMSKGQVQRMPLVIGAGAALRDGAPMALVLAADALNYAFALGDDAVKEACRAATADIYRRPESWLTSLEKGFQWVPRLLDLDAAAAHCAEAAAAPMVRGSRLDPQDLESKPRHRQVQLVTLHPAAARALPWLAPAG